MEDLFVPVENLVGGVEGQGLKLSNEVFGYTRLMVAALGLGGGMSALEKSIAYSKERVQFGTTLSEKQGYTHRLLVPNAVRLEASRAYLEHVAQRLDSDEKDLQVEGSIAKYFITEAADAMANDAIQALGGYGYIREYEVEKIKRDTKILCIFEGTSEIQKRLISMFRLQKTVRTKGGYYKKMAESLANLPEGCGAQKLSSSINLLNEIVISARKLKLTKSQYVMFQIADMMTWCEVGDTLCKKAADYNGRDRSPEFMNAAARLFVREIVENVFIKGMKVARGCDAQIDGMSDKLNALDIGKSMEDNLKDMDIISAELVK
jgi:alkylation response protein AidB-like acyl-CoA dehydrogenase